MEGSERFQRLMTLTRQPKNPAVGDVYFNPAMGSFMVYDGGGDWGGGWVDLVSAGPQELEKIKEKYVGASVGLEVAMEAIEMSHERGADGKCRAGCSGCAVRDRVESLATARRLME